MNSYRITITGYVDSAADVNEAVAAIIKDINDGIEPITVETLSPESEEVLNRGVYTVSVSQTVEARSLLTGR